MAPLTESGDSAAQRASSSLLCTAKELLGVRTVRVTSDRHLKDVKDSDLSGRRSNMHPCVELVVSLLEPFPIL